MEVIKVSTKEQLMEIIMYIILLITKNENEIVLITTNIVGLFEMLNILENSEDVISFRLQEPNTGFVSDISELYGDVKFEKFRPGGI